MGPFLPFGLCYHCPRSYLRCWCPCCCCYYRHCDWRWSASWKCSFWQGSFGQRTYPWSCSRQLNTLQHPITNTNHVKTSFSEIKTFLQNPKKKKKKKVPCFYPPR